MVLQVFDQWTSFVERVIRATYPTTIVETGVFDREPVSQWGDRENHLTRGCHQGERI
jgi:salicylate hydroxylase